MMSIRKHYVLPEELVLIKTGAQKFFIDYYIQNHKVCDFVEIRDKRELDNKKDSTLSTEVQITSIKKLGMIYIYSVR